ncbi:hypothetical protein JTB14_003108 [Gonioctena quinquepunctata]|nr:hypothetical protein JTB14_003108 [Gonioctena quinquepunctata]
MPEIRHGSKNKAMRSTETLSKAEVLMSQGHSMRSAAKAMNMPSISSIAVDSAPSTSPATLAPAILNSNIEDLLPSPVKMIPEKPIKKDEK